LEERIRMKVQANGTGGGRKQQNKRSSATNGRTPGKKAKASIGTGERKESKLRKKK